MTDVESKLRRLATDRRAKTKDQTKVQSVDYVALPDDMVYDEPNNYQFLRDFVKFSSVWSPRSPAASHEAVALHILSAAAAGRVVYDYGGRHRTSLYQFLVAGSTLYAKTTVANIGKDLLSEAGLGRVVIGRATPQSFFDQCLEKVPNDFDALSSTDQTRIRERLQNAAQRAWTADEFGAWAASMLREGSHYYEFRSLLLEIYDSPEYVEMSTRTHGTLPARRPTLSLFALSTYGHVTKIASAGSPFWRDGLLARFDFITTADGEEHNDAQFPPGQRVFPRELVDGLRRYDAMLGHAKVVISPVTETLNNGKEKTLRQDVEVRPQLPFVVSLSKDVYEAVHRYDCFLRKCIADGLVEDLHASYGRMPDRALRIACLLASYDGRNECELRDWKKAQCIVERRRQCLHWTYERLTDVSGAAEKVSRTDGILRYVGTERCVSARDIQTKFRRQFPSGMVELLRELDALVETGELHSVEPRKGRRLYAVDAESLPSTTGKGT